MSFDEAFRAPAVANFERVSYEQFYDAVQHNAPPSSWGKMISDIYNYVVIPRRSTTGSAGYDFVTPYKIKLAPGRSVVIPTGIRCKIAPGWLLTLFPRSGLGFKYRVQLDNTVGIIDSDYYNAENEGHIMAKITNDTNTGKILELEAGDRFMQGIFLPYGITLDDDASGIRTGGFGSTGV